MTGLLELIRGDGPLSRKDLADRTGLSANRVTTIVNELEAAGAVRRRADRKISAAGKKDVAASHVATAVAERREVQREYAKSAIEMMRTLAETTDCRRRIVLELLGEEHRERCGHCDNCDRGESVEDADRPYALGQHVRHPEWGKGTVQTYEEGDRIVVLFETAGYKTLALAVVEESDLLEPV